MLGASSTATRHGGSVLAACQVDVREKIPGFKSALKDSPGPAYQRGLARLARSLARRRCAAGSAWA
jgi:hypothetical protein